MGAEKGLSPHPQLTVMDEHTARPLNTAQKTHTGLLKGLFSSLYSETTKWSCPPKGLILKEWEAEIVTGGGVGVRLNVGVLPPLSYYHSSLAPPPKN